MEKYLLRLFVTGLIVTAFLLPSCSPAIVEEDETVSETFSVTAPVAPSVSKPTVSPISENTLIEVDSSNTFDFKGILFGETSSLTVSIGAIDAETGQVTINGVDTRRPTTPFTFEWGDGTTTSSFFPGKHIYEDTNKNYIVTVSAYYYGRKTSSIELSVQFSSPEVFPISIPDGFNVSIPSYPMDLETRLYNPRSSLTTFDDSFFTTVPRTTIEYVFTIFAMIQKDFVNDDIYAYDGKFEQVILRDSRFGGMYSVWYTNPVAFGAGDYGFQGSIEWSSFMHEMGHNVTLNTPADHYFGGKIDGSANAIYSESMAQILAHATAYYLLNHYEGYGIGDDLALDIKRSTLSSMGILKSAYEEYLLQGSPFSSWNNPSTPEDETRGTFMTIAYKFFEHAEVSSEGYRIPLKRMMALLQTFDQKMENGYDRQHNSKEGVTLPQ